MQNAIAGAAASTAGTVSQNLQLTPQTSNVIAGATGGALTAGAGPTGAVTGAIAGYNQAVLPSGSVPYTTVNGVPYVQNSDGSINKVFQAPNGYIYNENGTINQPLTAQNLALIQSTQQNTQALINAVQGQVGNQVTCLLYTSPSPRD